MTDLQHSSYPRLRLNNNCGCSSKWLPQLLLRFLAPIGALLCLVACQAANHGIDETLPSLSEQPATIQAATTLLAPSPSPKMMIIETATPVLAVEDSEVAELPHQNPAEINLATPNSNSPLRFTFPTPGADPVSVWRPPLYEVPWAPMPYDHFYFVRPIAADEVNWPLADYRYGATWFGPDIVHTGNDIVASRGTPVLAAGPGEVTWAGTGLYFGVPRADDPYGNAVVIQHDFGYKGDKLYTVYAHMDEISVARNQRVNTGTQLGKLGNTGNTTGPHLHFEVRIANNSFFETRNPELWLSPPQGWGVLVGRLTNGKNGLIHRQDVLVQSLSNTRTWKIRTYAPLAVKSDDYYQENLALSDLPAGDYVLSIEYQNKKYTYQITIHPGAISYFTFDARDGFNNLLPPLHQENDWLVPVSQ